MINDSKDPISVALNIAPNTATETAMVPVATAAVIPTEGNGDLELAQQNLKELVVKGNKALDSVIEVAELSQHPRAYEVVATTLTALGNINRQIVDIVKIRRDIEAPKDGKGETAKSITNQNVFVGSTAELAAILNNRAVREVKNG